VTITGTNPILDVNTGTIPNPLRQSAGSLRERVGHSLRFWSRILVVCDLPYFGCGYHT
jgi:hypothetical protein